MKKKFNTVYDHARPVSPNGGVSLTDKQYAQECDINHILKQYGATGRLPTVHREGVSGDFSDIGDFSNCLARIDRAKDEFAALPSSIRDRFGNDPKAYVEFCLNPDNAEECYRLGLRVKSQPKERTTNEILESIEKVVTPNKESVGA